MTYAEFTTRMIALKGRPASEIKALIAEFNDDPKTSAEDTEKAFLAIDRCISLYHQRRAAMAQLTPEGGVQ